MPNLPRHRMEPCDSREVGSHRGVDRRRPPRPRNPAQLSQTAVVLPRLRRQWASRRVVQWQNGVLITRKSEVRSLPLRPASTREARASALVRLITGQPGGSIRSRHQPTGIADPQRRGFRDAPGQRPPVLPLPPRFPVALPTLASILSSTSAKIANAVKASGRSPDYVGSTPTLGTSLRPSSKGRASDFHSEDLGSSPCGRSRYKGNAR